MSKKVSMFAASKGENEEETSKMKRVREMAKRLHVYLYVFVVLFSPAKNPLFMSILCTVHEIYPFEIYLAG